MSAVPPVGLVLGTTGHEATPLEFWVAVDPDRWLQLDDVVALERTPPGGERVRIYGVVAQVRARHEGARFDSDVFLIADGTLPAGVAEAAQVLTTRVEPEVFVPPLPGQAVRLAEGDERLEALFFDGMESRVPAGATRDGQPVFLNREFVDGTRGAHVNISGVSGVATKTSYATFLLHSIFASDTSASRHNTRALIFNVKGEDLLFLDHDNTQLNEDHRERYRRLGLPASAFDSVEFWAPPIRGASSGAPDTGSRKVGISSFHWSLAEFCADELLPFLFTDAQDDRQQYTMVVHNVTARLRSEAHPLGDGGVAIDGTEIRTFRALIDFIQARLEDEATMGDWAGRAIGAGTINAFIRRLYGAQKHVEHVIRGDLGSSGQIKREKQVTVVDIHNLNDRAKRFVVGVVLQRMFEQKEQTGTADPRTFVVLDELNKYAPREGHSPIKEILLDIAERGRSLGIILIGAQQTASEVERRIIANSAIRVVGRLDAAEASREEYGFLPAAHRQRATILKPGAMIVSQPELPVPLALEFPFPAWATRPSEAGAAPPPDQPAAALPDDPFDAVTAASSDAPF
ncbi:MAG: ATP-binding protein [Nitriliruptorales bacterium]|nr:ATP-binding protein [Nitriliruptorales bacterium]